ncbi:cation:proton antiporter, partial [Candidatus Woesearchaeota archaeon]|nr:cation:proton antiporter [Candidatus Woesearchaeota archaeon]
IVFDSTSRLKIKEFDEFALSALKLTLVVLIVNLALLSLFTFFIAGVPVVIALLFSALMSGTAPDIVLPLLGEAKHKAIELLKIEAIINTPIIVIVPFVIVDFIQSVEVQFLMSKFIEQIGPFFQQIVTGIGAGILVGLIVFKVMRKYYAAKLSPIAVIASALIAYVLAENLGGNGVLAVTTMGLFFGSIYVKQKEELQEFSSIFSNALEILIFILIGFIIKVPFTVDFFWRSFLLFAIYLGLRFTIIKTMFSNEYKLREKLFVTLNCPKGIAVAVVVFLLVTIPEVASSGMADFVLAFMLYSIVFSSVTARFSRFLIKREVIKPAKTT